MREREHLRESLRELERELEKKKELERKLGLEFTSLHFIYKHPHHIVLSILCPVLYPPLLVVYHFLLGGPQSFVLLLILINVIGRIALGSK